MLEENIEAITKLNINFAPTFVDHNFLPDMNNNVSIPKKAIRLYSSYALTP